MEVGALPPSVLRRIVNPERHVSDATLERAVSGRVVLVTGASHGIGRATCERLAAAGAELLMVARSTEILDELAAEAGPRARALPCDLADLQQVAQLIEAVRDRPIEVVVSNAGKSIRRSSADTVDRFDDVTRTNAINYLGPVALLLGLLPGMRARGRGHIVNVSTVGLLLPAAPRWSAYLASKAAFDVWLRSVSAETAGDGVTVSSLYMALVHTRMSAPTSDFDRVPGLSPAQAAEIVGHAIVERPATVGPWWASAAGAFSALAPGASGALMRRYGRRFGS